MHLGWICTGSLSSCTDRPHPGGRGHNQGGVVVVGLKIGDNILKWGVTMRDTCHLREFTQSALLIHPVSY